MAKKLVPATTFLLIGGVAFFTVGLLMILRINPVFGLFSQLLPSLQVVEAVGVAVQFLGQALVVFGVIKLTSHNLLSGIQSERQIAMDGFTQNMRLLQAGYVQTMAKLDTVIANQKAASILPKPLGQSNCKFCGAQMARSRFCPQCGKAN
jgi:hypothetical protein